MRRLPRPPCRAIVCEMRAASRGASRLVRVLAALGLLAACSARSGQQAVGAGATARAAEPAAIEGQVLGGDGVPVAGVLVSASSHFDVPTPEPLYYEQHTAADGRFRFGGLPAGQYGITATPSGAGAAYGGVCSLPSASPCRLLLRVGRAGAAYRG